MACCTALDTKPPPSTIDHSPLTSGSHTLLHTSEHVQRQHKPHGKSLDHHFSVESRSFAGSALKKMSNQIVKHRLIPLGTGRPHARFYPWRSGACQEDSQHGQARPSTPGKCRTKIDIKKIISQEESYDLTKSLNYGHAAGSQPLLKFLTEHTEMLHHPPYEGWGVCLSSGTTSALEIALRMFCNRGETVLTEVYTYPGMIEATRLLGLRTLGVKMNAGGISDTHIRSVLHDWDISNGPRPRVLYTIPSGQNPTGSTQSLQRKQAVYRIAEEYDVIIIEDDPYYLLPTTPRFERLRNSAENEAQDESNVAKNFLARLSSSFLSLDQSGRVVRLDSMSKILAPGLRAGWVTASNQIIDKFISYHEVSTVAVSGATQLMLWNLLGNAWGHLGFLSWLDQLSLQYSDRLNIMLQACDKYLPKSICAWVPPQHGMFLWINLDLLQHPACRPEGNSKSLSTETLRARVAEIEKRINDKGVAYGVQVTIGSLFDANEASSDVVLHFRLTYAAVADELELDEGVMKFARAVKDEFGLSH